MVKVGESLESLIPEVESIDPQDSSITALRGTYPRWVVNHETSRGGTNLLQNHLGHGRNYHRNGNPGTRMNCVNSQHHHHHLTSASPADTTYSARPSPKPWRPEPVGVRPNTIPPRHCITWSQSCDTLRHTP